jgi:hypothetical protein
VLVHARGLGKKSQALLYETTNEILDAWRDSEAYRTPTKEQLFGEGACDGAGGRPCARRRQDGHLISSREQGVEWRGSERRPRFQFSTFDRIL